MKSELREELEKDLEGFNHGRLSPIELVESIARHLNECSDFPAVDWSKVPDEVDQVRYTQQFWLWGSEKWVHHFELADFSRPKPIWTPEPGKVYGFWDTDIACRPWIGEFSNQGNASKQFGAVNREQVVIFWEHIIELESLEDALHTVAELKAMGRRWL